MHTRLTERVTPLNQALQMPDVSSTIALATETGKAMLDMIVTQQATLIAYLNDFKLLMFMTFGMIPLIFIIGKSRRPTGEKREEAAVLE